MSQTPVSNDAVAALSRQFKQKLNQLTSLALIGGVVGGLIIVLVVTSSSRIRKTLGIDESSPLNLTRTIEQRYVVEESSGFIQAVKRVSPTVVSITTEETGIDFFGRTVQRSGAGTGFILTSDGLIATNKHVVEGGEKFKVVLADGKSYDATVKARDPYADLAILKIEATGLPVIELGDSESLEVGQWVLAIGNALGEFNNSVSVGVVSGKNRLLEAGTAELSGLIQTDATINPGNSGGPLVNIKGQVVGISTAIASPTGSSVGVGFAIPVNSIKKAIDSVRKTGKIIRPRLGLRYLLINQAIEEALSLPIDRGALIRASENQPGIVPGGPAEKAGLKEGDIILEMNKDRIDEQRPLASLLTEYSPGDEVTLLILRDKARQEIKLTLEALE
ncbi:MAG: Protease Do [Candidatus Berkelbacteria bacterium Gr01-1014_85]|uniref:Protease Do n=1 Tax=Candidatus Berkelbacteria bacterium Gr01-1014_85 TaxID=2017150 RepID=A0A554JA95_9BACT|nr:MAG: Protease Do [Candidatus Berkelbacteria bacterium Gr01-1014_85]